MTRSFQVLEAWANGDLAALSRLATLRLGKKLLEDDRTQREWLDPRGWRGAATLWLSSRTVGARTDGKQGFVRFHQEGERLFVLTFEYEANLPKLDGTRSIPAAEFEAFGQPV